MHPFDYLAVLRRRWIYVVIAPLVGAVAGFLTAPGAGAEEEVRYEATHQLLVDVSSSAGQTLNLQQAALVATGGAVPERVEARLEEAGLPALFGLEAVPDLDARSLDLTATAATAEGAARGADLAAEELNAELVSADQAVVDRNIEAAEERVASLQDEIESIDQQRLVVPPEDPARQALDDQRDGLATSLAQAQSELALLEADGAVAPPFRSLQVGEGRPADEEGWAIPESKPVRAGMLGAFGLLLGVGGALAADRLDTRVRGKEDAERAFDLPVVAEIPSLPSGAKRGELLVATRPASPFVEACRALRTVVLFAASNNAEDDAQTTNGSGASAPPAQVVLVTSPSAGEGKTTTTAHLAATLAEFGKRVLVISADFRRPRIHEVFGVPREPGLSDVLDAGSGRVRLSDLQMATSFKGVHLLPSGGPVDNPAQLLTETAQLISAARALFDFIVVDTPPLLVANDATELAVEADMVLIMAKADRTSREGARRSVEILRRVEAPLLGVVVAAAHDAPSAYGYYRYRYYADTDQGAKGLRRKRGDDEQATSLAATVATDGS
jgi:capsular exopolysaccharide synthesis family protein